MSGANNFGGRDLTLDEKKRKEWRLLAMASSMGISMVLATVIGLALGLWLDGLLGTKPWLTLIFLVVGIVAGFRNLYIIGKRATKNNDQP